MLDGYVLWIWFLVRYAREWQTGPIERYFTFLCARCAVGTPAMVRTFGSARGRDLDEAQRRAYVHADELANRKVAAAACPQCGQPRAETIDQLERAAKRLARRKALRLPVTLLVALLSAALFAIPAIRDLRHSVGLAVVALAGATLLGAVAFAILSSRVAVAQPNPFDVWFSRDPSQGPSSWFPAQPGPVPELAQPNGALQWRAICTMAAAAIALIGGVFLWSTSFRTIFVVSTEGARGELVVRIDDVEAGRVSHVTGFDAPYRRFEVRASSAHHVAIVDSAGGRLTYDLDPSTASRGWVVAPHARERGLCLLSETWYYGRQPEEGSDGLLNDMGAGDLVELQQSFDFVLTSPPETIYTKSGTGTRSSLRAYDCGALEQEQLVPFVRAEHHEEDVP